MLGILISITSWQVSIDLDTGDRYRMNRRLLCTVCSGSEYLLFRQLFAAVSGVSLSQLLNFSPRRAFALPAARARLRPAQRRCLMERGVARSTEFARCLRAAATSSFSPAGAPLTLTSRRRGVVAVVLIRIIRRPARTRRAPAHTRRAPSQCRPPPRRAMRSHGNAARRSGS